MLKIKVKASQITNLTDARYFAAKEVEWLSFNFREGAENYIDPMKARAMFEWVEGPRIVGEFDGLTAADINFYTEGYQLQHIQVGNETTVAAVFDLKATSVIKEIVVRLKHTFRAATAPATLSRFAACVITFASGLPPPPPP